MVLKKESVRVNDVQAPLRGDILKAIVGPWGQRGQALNDDGGKAGHILFVGHGGLFSEPHRDRSDLRHDQTAIFSNDVMDAGPASICASSASV